jgi:hypothetical protein
VGGNPDDLDLAIDTEVVLRDYPKDAVHLVNDLRNAIQPFEFCELRGWDVFRHELSFHWLVRRLKTGQLATISLDVHSDLFFPRAC